MAKTHQHRPIHQNLTAQLSRGSQFWLSAPKCWHQHSACFSIFTTVIWNGDILDDWRGNPSTALQHFRAGNRAGSLQIIQKERWKLSHKRLVFIFLHSYIFKTWWSLAWIRPFLLPQMQLTHPVHPTGPPSSLLPPLCSSFYGGVPYQDAFHSCASTAPGSRKSAPLRDPL